MRHVQFLFATTRSGGSKGHIISCWAKGALDTFLYGLRVHGVGVFGV